MTNRFITNNQIHNATVHRSVSRRVFVWFIIFSILGVLISCGFFVSARQHFEALSLGYNTEELRREEARLQEKMRRLELEKARVTSTVEMEKRARQLGLVRPSAQSPTIRRPIN
jgi:cell division protein FtsL